MPCDNCFCLSILSLFGFLSLVVRICSGVVLTFCNNPDSKWKTSSYPLPLDDDIVTSPITKVGLFVVFPTILFPGLGLVTQHLVCRKHRTSCDFIGFVQMFSLIPTSLLEILTLSFSQCLISNNFLVLVHLFSCLSCFGIFITISCLSCKKKSETSNTNLSEPFLLIGNV